MPYKDLEKRKAYSKVYQKSQKFKDYKKTYHNKNKKRIKQYYLLNRQKIRFKAIWHGILSRCKNPKDSHYKYYGGRGIRCEWSSFYRFRDAMYESYLSHKKDNRSTTIERIDNNKNYSVDNCRWATNTEQSRNRTDNVFITHEGRTMILQDWADELNLDRHTIIDRVRNGYPINRSRHYKSKHNSKSIN